MNGKDALDAVIEAIKKFHRGNPNAKPSQMNIHWDLAYDLAKLGKSGLGDLFEKIWKDGIKALETEGFMGIKVVIDFDSEGSKVTIC